MAFGAAHGSKRYVAFENDFAGSDKVEFQIVRTNDGVVTFDAIALSWIRRCGLLLGALSEDNALLEAFYAIGDGGGQAHRFVRFVVPADQAVPRLVDDETSTRVPQHYAVSESLWAASFAANRAMQWRDLSVGSQESVGWTSPDGREILALQALGTTILATTALVHRSYATLMWNPTDGARPLIEYPSIDQGGACCTGSDGTDMVWFEGSGWQRPDANVIDAFSEVLLMASPFVTRPEDLRPRKVRRAFQNFFLGNPIKVGAGFALANEALTGTDENRLILTRIADGSFLTIPPKAGFHWGNPLYVDDVELAVLELPNQGPDSFQKPTSIVRFEVAKLGPFRDAGAGF